jgi:hypothetical protein
MKTTSGATAVQIAYKKSNIVKIIRTGSAHSGEELNILLAFAFKRLQVDRLALFPETQRSLRVCIKVRFPFFFLEVSARTVPQYEISQVGCD